MAFGPTCSAGDRPLQSATFLPPRPIRSRCCSRLRPFSGTDSMAGLGFVTGIAPRDRVLVVIFLRGGADGLTLVAPVADDAYHRARPTLRVRENEGVRLDDVFALHPRLAGLAPLWTAGELAIVHSVGSEDATRSHFEAQDLMEHGGTVAGGWLGRFLRNRTLAQRGALSAVAFGTELPAALSG